MALGGQQHAAQHSQRGGLARAIGAEKSVDAARGDVEVDMVHRDLGAEFSRELPRGYRVGGVAHGASSSSSSVTSTGTPEGRASASASSNTTSARNDRRDRSAAVSE